MKQTTFIYLSFILLAACNSPKKQEAINAATTSDSVASPTATTKNPDVSEFVAEVDADKDGKMTKAEWKAKGLPETSFNGFEKGRGYVTQEDYEKNAAPAGIDANNDGKLTVAEFVAFDKEMAARMKSGGTPPPPPAKP